MCAMRTIMAIDREGVMCSSNYSHEYILADDINSVENFALSYKELCFAKQEYYLAVYTVIMLHCCFPSEAIRRNP